MPTIMNKINEKQGSNKYIYHYCALTDNATVDGILHLTNLVKNMTDYRNVKKIIAGDEYNHKSIVITCLQYLGQHFV